MTNKTLKHPLVSLLVAIIVPFIAAAIGGTATGSSVTSWYPTLEKPAWNPPSWLFGPVWTLLYLLMGVASWLVWREKNEDNAESVRRALGWYGIQLGLNALWSVLFFGLRRVDLALAEIVLLWSALLITVAGFRRIRPLAGWLLLPYLLWTSFAALLNATIWWLNRG